MADSSALNGGWRSLPGRVGRRVSARRRRQQFARRLDAPAARRDVPVEATHLGPIADAEIARVKGNIVPGRDAEYDLAAEHFDPLHFLLQAPHLLARPDVDPLRHFLANGAEAKASPELGFSMSAYLERYPHRAHGPEISPYVAWLREGRAAGEIGDPAAGLPKVAPLLGSTAPEMAAQLNEVRTDIRDRLLHGRLGEMFAKACEVEPLISESWAEMTRPQIPPFLSPRVTTQIAAIAGAHAEADFRRAKVLLVAGDPRWGASRRIEGHIAHALAEQIDPSEIVVIYTEKGGRAPKGRFPDGVREVDLASKIAGIEPPLAGWQALVELVRSFKADLVLNVNSPLLHLAMGTYGKALDASERIVPVFFGNEQQALGTWAGLPLRYFYRVFDNTDTVITDSDHLAGWLRERHQLTDEMAARITVLRAPVDPSIALAKPPADAPGRRPQVFWSGRFDRQKRIDLAFEVARLMPDVDLQVWGEPVLSRRALDEAPANLRLNGVYTSFADLPLDDADAWLYTSAWDGVPSLLLEVAMTGIPLVASRVAGTGEVVEDADGWPVDDVDDPAAYVARLREVLADPAAARERAAAMRERLIADRSAAAYAEQVAALLKGSDR